MKEYLYTDYSVSEHYNQAIFLFNNKRNGFCCPICYHYHPFEMEHLKDINCSNCESILKKVGDGLTVWESPNWKDNKLAKENEELKKQVDELVSKVEKLQKKLYLIQAVLDRGEK